MTMALAPSLSDPEADPAILAPAFIDPASGRFSFSFNSQHPLEAGDDSTKSMEAETNRASILGPYSPHYPAWSRGLPAGPAHGWGYPSYPAYNPWSAAGGYPGAYHPGFGRGYPGAYHPGFGRGYGYQPAFPGYYGFNPYHSALPIPSRESQQD